MLWRSRSSSSVVRQYPAGFIEPCLPTNARTVPIGSQWAYEIKHDGFRFICRRDGERVWVFSRNGRDWTDRVPLIAEALAKLRVTSVTLDGEGVVCRSDGVSDFDRLRAAVGRLGSRDAFLYAFDLLELDGENMRPYEWHVRRATLRSLVKRAGPGIRLRIILKAMAAPHSGTPAAWGLRASSPSGAIGPIDPAARRTGSRSRTRTRRRRAGSWSGERTGGPTRMANEEHVAIRGRA